MTNKPLPPLSLLQEYLSYDGATGILLWNKKFGKISPGMKAGHTDARGYSQLRFYGRLLYVHRVCYYLFHQVDPWKLNIDHINGDKGDNRAANLRVGTQSQNLCNTGARKHSKSGIKGVSWCKASNKWLAQIQFKNKKEIIGRFDSVEAATSAVISRRKSLHLQFAKQ